MHTLLGLAVIAGLVAVLVWRRVLRWPTFACWCCGGSGRHSRVTFAGRTLRRPCRVCGGRGEWLRLGAKTKAKRR